MADADVLIAEVVEAPPLDVQLAELADEQWLDGYHERLSIEQRARADAVLMFGDQWCLTTTLVRAGEVEHAHVCLRRPHPMDEDHCSHTLYVWRSHP